MTADTSEATSLPSIEQQRSKRREWLLFLFLVVVLFPALTVLAVGAYGMAVWIFQMFAGPPGV